MGIPLTAAQRADLARIAVRRGLRLIVAFGSQPAGHAHVGSDLDLAVQPAGSADLSLDAVADLLADLSAVLPDDPIDLTILPHADSLLLKNIFESGILLHGDEAEFRRYRVYAFRRYSEYLPYLKLEAEATKRMIERLRHAP